MACGTVHAKEHKMLSKTMMRAAAVTLVLGAMTLSVASADSLIVVNPNFSAVAVQCSSGWAYESYMGGNCESYGPQQDFNAEVGIGWTFAMGTYESYGSGITNADTSFNPPPFSGLPFSQAAIVQGSEAVRALVAQKISGFVAGQLYKLTFFWDRAILRAVATVTRRCWYCLMTSPSENGSWLATLHLLFGRHF